MPDSITPAVDGDDDRRPGDDSGGGRATTRELGTLRIRHERTNEVILIPTPSRSEDDPLNWPYWYKYYVTGLASWSIFLCTFCIAGPSVLIPDLAISFFSPVQPGSSPAFLSAVAKAAYLFTVPSLLMGLSNALWVPLMIKRGRRPVYVASFALLAGSSAWAASAPTGSYASIMAARALMGCAAGAGEVLGPLTVGDLFFAHERGAMMGVYTCLLSLGTGVGAVASGAAASRGGGAEDWRLVFWICFALAAFTTLLMFVSIPETVYLREEGGEQQQQQQRNRGRSRAGAGNNMGEKDDDGDDEDVDIDEEKLSKKSASAAEYAEDATPADAAVAAVAGRVPGLREVATTWPTRAYTSEPLWKLAARPAALIVLPSALWASLVMAVSIGFMVATSSNLSTAFAQSYGFATWQVGLTMLSAVVGSLAAAWFGGPLSDRCSDWMTRRNGGIKEPEFRLPAIAVSLVTGPLSMILYGVGIEKRLHWMCPVVGLGLINFTVVQASNIGIVYMIDCYRPISGEITQTQYGFKSLFGFLLSFYTNPWIEQSGYLPAFGEMAAISFAVFFCGLPFYLWGKKIRRASWNWPLVRAVARWDPDREVGE